MRNATEKKIEELSLFYTTNRYRFIFLGGLFQLSRVFLFDSKNTLRIKRDIILKTEEAEDIFDSLLDHIEDGLLTSLHIDHIFDLKDMEESSFDFFYYGVEFVNKFLLFTLSIIICFLTIPIIDLFYNGMYTLYRIEDCIGIVSVISILYASIIIIFLKFRKQIENILLIDGENK